MSSQLSDKLQKLQNHAARVITKLPYDTSLNLLLEKLKWEKLSKRCQTQKALMMFKSIQKLAPEYLSQLFTTRCVKYNLRNLKGKVDLPKPHANYLKRSFSYTGALLWNNLPQQMRDVGSIANCRNMRRLGMNCCALSILGSLG